MTRNPPLTLKRTGSGFQWGATHVEAACEHQGHVILHIRTEKALLSVRVTPSGLIRTEQTQQRRKRDNART